MDDQGEDRLTEGTATGRRRNPTGRFARESRDVLDEREADERGHDEREATADRDMTEEDRFDIFQSSLEQSVLPDLPQTPGYHTCWLTTSNPRDTIPYRMRIGYELIPFAEMPGWNGASVQSAAYPGTIQVNEMVAARIPLSLYNRYMRELHETKPRSEEEKLRARVELMKQQAQQVGSRIGEGDGTEQMVAKAPPMPEFLS